MEVGINVEGGIFWKKLVYKSNKRGVEGGFLFCGGWDFLKSVSVGSTFIREMRVDLTMVLKKKSDKDFKKVGSICGNLSFKSQLTKV